VVHGGPDWGVEETRPALYGLADLAELSVRQCGAYSLDRLGSVICWTRFDDGLEGWEEKTGVGPTDIFLSTYEPLNGAYCVELVRQDVEDGIAWARKKFVAPVNTVLGVEAFFRSQLWKPDVMIEFYTAGGGSAHTFGVLLADSTDEIAVRDAVGDYVKVADLTPYLFGSDYWFGVKLVYDTVTDKYVRLRVGGETYDLSAYSGLGGVAEISSYASVTVIMTRPDDEWTLWHMDNVVLTAYEP